MTVIPAYGRDYTSAKAARADWDANRDFMISDVSLGKNNGRYVNKEQVKNETVLIRYNRLRNTTIIEPTKEKS